MTPEIAERTPAGSAPEEVLHLPPNRHYGFIDGLRGLAILGVLLIHCGQAAGTGLPPLLLRFTGAGAFGVHLFFVVSAFTLFLSLSNPRPERWPLVSFFARRLFRIAPAYWLILLIVIWPEIRSFHLSNKLEVLSVATFTNGLNPYWISSIVPGGWSVTAEMTFYLFVPYLFKRIKTVQQGLILTLVVAAISTALDAWVRSDSFSNLVKPLVASRLVNPEHMLNQAPVWSHWFVTFWFPTQAPVFCMGILAFRLAGHLNSRPRNGALPFWLLSASGLVFLLAVFLPPSLIQPEHIAAISFALLVLSASVRPWRFLTHPAMQYLGRISFSVYLTHFFVRDLVLAYLSRMPPLNPTTRFAVIFTSTLVLAMAASTVTFYLVESQGIDLCKRLLRRFNRPSTLRYQA